MLQLLPVDTENTMDEVAAAAAVHSVGRRVRARPDCILRVRRQDAKEFFPRTMKVAEAGLKPTETVEIIWEAA
ncbi:MAG: toluene monooxygenase [Lysobacter sp.]|nr:toluene monooxygenase [Lysobacter sp.]